jgi:hypothetical protein
MNNLDDFLEFLAANSEVPEDAKDLWDALWREYLDRKAEAGFTFFNEILKRSEWKRSGEWKALSFAPLAEPESSKSGRVISTKLVIKNVETGEVAHVAPGVIEQDLSKNPGKVHQSLLISVRKHGRDKTIRIVQLALVFGWLDDEHADFWLIYLNMMPTSSASGIELKP